MPGSVVLESVRSWRRPLWIRGGYKGTCYNAAGWINCGRTAGYARVGGRDFYQDNERPKNLWLKPLHKDALSRLKDPTSLLPGESTVSGIFRFCQDLTSVQRLCLGFRSKPQAPRVVPPPGEGCWRKVLGAVDPDELAKALKAWMQAQRKNGELPALLSIDGKVIGNNLATLVSLVDARDGTPLAQAAASGNGQEQKLTKELILALPEGSLEGKTVKGDALYSNKNLVREIV